MTLRLNPAGRLIADYLKVNNALEIEGAVKTDIVEVDTRVYTINSNDYIVHVKVDGCIITIPYDTTDAYKEEEYRVIWIVTDNGYSAEVNGHILPGGMVLLTKDGLRVFPFGLTTDSAFIYDGANIVKRIEGESIRIGDYMSNNSNANSMIINDNKLASEMTGSTLQVYGNENEVENTIIAQVYGSNNEVVNSNTTQVLGYTNDVEGTFKSTVVGSQNQLNNVSSAVAIGEANNAKDNTIALGSNNYTTSPESIMVGQRITCDSAIAVGNFLTAGNESVSIANGVDTNSSETGQQSVVINSLEKIIKDSGINNAIVNSDGTYTNSQKSALVSTTPSGTANAIIKSAVLATHSSQLDTIKQSLIVGDTSQLTGISRTNAVVDNGVLINVYNSSITGNNINVTGANDSVISGDTITANDCDGAIIVGKNADSIEHLNGIHYGTLINGFNQEVRASRNVPTTGTKYNLVSSTGSNPMDATFYNVPNDTAFSIHIQAIIKDNTGTIAARTYLAVGEIDSNGDLQNVVITTIGTINPTDVVISVESGAAINQVAIRAKAGNNTPTRVSIKANLVTL